MMSESNKVFSTLTSSSRLSPLALPFTISNPLNRHESFDPLLDSSSSSSSSSSSGFDQPFPYLSLGGQGHHGYYAYHSGATSITAFPCVDDLDFEPNSRFAYCPLEVPPVHTHFTLPTHQSSQTSSSSSLGNVGQSGVKGTAVDQQGREIPHNKDQIGIVGSLSCNNLLEQGTTVEGSKLASETTSVLHGKGSMVIGKDNQIRPEGKEKRYTESSIFVMAKSELNLLNNCMTKPFLISLDLSFSPGSQDTQSRLSYSAPLMTWNHSDSTIITNESCIPHLGSLGAETLVSCGPDCFSYSAQIFKPSSASSNPPIVNPVPLENIASSDIDAVSNKDSYFGYVVPSVIEADIVQNPVDKVACHDQVITENGEKIKILEPFHIGTKNPSIVAKSKLQIACPNVPEDLTLEQHGAKAGITDDKSSINHDDSDVDSPCWKGTQAYKSPLRDTVPVNSEDSKVQSPSRVSVPLKLEHSKNEKVARNSLNPLAPMFIPGNSKQKVDYHQKECHGDRFSSFQKIAALASREHKLIDSVKSGTCPSERINDLGIQCSSDACDSRKEYGVPYKSFRSSAVNSSCGFQPYLREEYVTSENQLVRGMSVAGSMDGILDEIHNGLDSVEDIVHNGPNTSISFLTSEIGLNSHSIGVGIFSEPFPYLSLGGQGHHGYYDYHSDATSITAFPCVDDLDFEPNSRFAYYPLEEPPVHTHFTLPTHQSSQTSSSSSLGNVGQSGVKGTAVDQQGREIPHNKDQIGIVGSLSCNNLLEQGTTVEGSKLVSETSVLHGKGSVVIGKDNQIRPEDKEKIHTESSIFVMANSEVNLLNKCMTKPFSISSDLSCSPGPQYTQIQMSYSAPLMTWNHSDSTIITNKSCIPHLGSLRAETLASCGPDCFSYSAQIFKPSSASSNPPIVNPVPLENVASSDTDAVSNRDSYISYVVPSVIDADIVQNPVDKVACHDLVITENGEKRKILEPVHNGTKNPSIVAKSKLEIACTNVPEDLTLEQHGAKEGIPDDKSSTNHDDSDVDSPCWKGAQAYKSPFRDTMPVNSEDSKVQSPSRVSVPLKLEHSKNEKVARNRLNPLAPMFIPGNSKQKVDYHQKECHGDSSSSFQKIAALESIEHKLIDSVKSGTCPSERINDIGIQCSSDVCDSRKEYGVPYKSFRSSAVNSSCGFQRYLREEYVTSEDQLVRGTSVAGSMDGILDAIHNGLDSVEDIVHNGPNTSISFLTSEVGLNSHSIGVGIFSDFTERLQEPSKSRAPKIEVKSMINTIQYLSELLLQNFSLDLGSLSEHEHGKLLNIINNLYVIRNEAGQMTVRPELSDPCTLYGQTQPADYHEVTKVKDKAVLHDQEMHKTPASMLSSRMLYSFCQSNDDEDFRKANDISQIEDIEMPPEALFYRKLWLEAKAALNLMKYQAHALHMKSELDRC